MREEKKCPRCGEIKPLGDYYLTKRGLDAYCKKCRNKNSTEYKRRKNRAKGVFMSKHDGRLHVFDGKGGHGKIYWTGDMLSILNKYYKNTHNQEVAELLGIHVSTLRRKVRELGLKKSSDYVHMCKTKGGRLNKGKKYERDEYGRFCGKTA